MGRCLGGNYESYSDLVFIVACSMLAAIFAGPAMFDLSIPAGTTVFVAGCLLACCIVRWANESTTVGDVFSVISILSAFVAGMFSWWAKHNAFAFFFALCMCGLFCLVVMACFMMSIGGATRVLPQEAKASGGG